MAPLISTIEELSFTEFRRKVRDSEVLSTSITSLARSLGFSGRITIVLQNGNVQKCGYEESLFPSRHRASR
jgi:hypothetical protein